MKEKLEEEGVAVTIRGLNSLQANNCTKSYYEKGIMYMKIAVAVDGSENALRAANHAITLAQHFPKAQLEVIYVADYNKVKDERLLSQS